MSALSQPVNVGTGFVLFRDGHVLLGRRKGAHGAGEWSFPGGKPDGGESPRTAALRELEEETGVQVPNSTVSEVPKWTYDRFPDDDLHYVTLYFTATAPPEAQVILREPEKCEAWEWFRVHTYDPAIGDFIRLPEGSSAFPGVKAALGSLDIGVVTPQRFDPYAHDFNGDDY